MSTSKARASKHASRSWTCPCGRTVFGNGGKSSHQRSCVTFKEHQIEKLRTTLDQIERGVWGKGLRKVTIERFRREFEAELATLEEGLG